MTDWAKIEQQISNTVARPFVIEQCHAVGGGCINQTYRVSGAGQHWFVKLNHASGLEMFEAEARGLAELAAATTIRVPEPLCHGIAGGQAYLVMEYIDMVGGARPGLLGRQLAALHRVVRPRYGLEFDNTIGSTRQINHEEGSWCEFWRRHRLGFQLQLAAQRGYGGALQVLGGELMERFPALFCDYRPQASLLHGDLWGGNCAGDPEGNPVIYDPAVYYGDRETDLAMTELFGGFGAGFFTAYNEAFPVDQGYPVRKVFYNLYHILNHANMFGGGYVRQAAGMMQSLLAELR